MERARLASAGQPSSSQPADPFATFAELSVSQPPTQPPPQQQQVQQQRPSSNNPFAPNRRMPWDIRPTVQPAGRSSVSGQDPFAALPPLFAAPSLPAQPPPQPSSSKRTHYPPVQQYRPTGIPQQQQQPQLGPSWQATFPQPLANGSRGNSASVPRQHLPSVTDDEALAQALQQQLDMEVGVLSLANSVSWSTCACTAVQCCASRA